MSNKKLKQENRKDEDANLANGLVEPLVNLTYYTVSMAWEV